MRRDDVVRLHHMLDAARDAVGFAEGKIRDDLDSDRQLVMAVVKCVEIIGEASSRISEETRAEIPDLPWNEMINMRHRLVHAYYDINLNIVWVTIQQDLPSLIEILETVDELK